MRLQSLVRHVVLLTVHGDQMRETVAKGYKTRLQSTEWRPSYVATQQNWQYHGPLKTNTLVLLHRYRCQINLSVDVQVRQQKVWTLRPRYVEYCVTLKSSLQACSGWASSPSSCQNFLVHETSRCNTLPLGFSGTRIKWQYHQQSQGDWPRVALHWLWSQPWPLSSPCKCWKENHRKEARQAPTIL